MADQRLTRRLRIAPSLAQFNRTREREPLSEPELRAYLEAIRAEPHDARRDALELKVYLGGQRPMQFACVALSDVDIER